FQPVPLRRSCLPANTTNTARRQVEGIEQTGKLPLSEWFAELELRPGSILALIQDVAEFLRGEPINPLRGEGYRAVFQKHDGKSLLRIAGHFLSDGTTAVRPVTTHDITDGNQWSPVITGATTQLLRHDRVVSGPQGCLIVGRPTDQLTLDRN